MLRLPALAVPLKVESTVENAYVGCGQTKAMASCQCAAQVWLRAVCSTAAGRAIVAFALFKNSTVVLVILLLLILLLYYLLIDKRCSL